jgi:hypothetical protein
MLSNAQNPNMSKNLLAGMNQAGFLELLQTIFEIVLRKG